MLICSVGCLSSIEWEIGSHKRKAAWSCFQRNCECGLLWENWFISSWILQDSWCDWIWGSDPIQLFHIWGFLQWSRAWHPHRWNSWDQFMCFVEFYTSSYQIGVKIRHCLSERHTWDEHVVNIVGLFLIFGILPVSRFFFFGIKSWWSAQLFFPVHTPNCDSLLTTNGVVVVNVYIISLKIKAYLYWSKNMATYIEVSKLFPWDFSSLWQDLCIATSYLWYDFTKIFRR